MAPHQPQPCRELHSWCCVSRCSWSSPLPGVTPGALLDGKAAPLEGFAAVLSRPTQRALIITNCLSIYKREQQRGARLGQLWLSPCTTGLFVPTVLLGTWPPCPCAWEKALPWPVSFGETHYFFNFFFFLLQPLAEQ